MKSLFVICLFVLTVVGNTLSAQDLAVVDHATVEPMAVSTKKVALTYQQAASFRGGDIALAYYLQENLEYPTLARQNSKEGTVTVQVALNSDGTVKEASVVESLGYGFDEEAVRLVSNMPAWIPAQQGPNNIPSKVRIPIEFKLW